MSFKVELESLINKYSKENGSNTPDFLLADYLNDCLETFNNIVMKRSDWYGNRDTIGWTPEIHSGLEPGKEE
jgi:hypothetical protein